MNYLQRLRKRWLNWNVKRACAGDAAAMDRLYLMGDPWGLDSKRERFRFEETSRLIRERVGARFGSILEIGCGEGLQTEYLVPLGGEIVGLDPSAHAIKRARERGLGKASFEVGTLTTYAGRPAGPFELVTACEVLYYLNDFEDAVARLNRLARACVVTYYQGAFARLDPFFAQKQVQRETIRGTNCEWRVVWWRQARA